jgi:alpha-1,2-mannosyltransferase
MTHSQLRELPTDREPRTNGLGFLGPVVALLLSVAAVICLALLVGSLNRYERWRGHDYSQWYISALVLRSGSPLYTTDLLPLGHELHMATEDRANYPPTFILAFEPLTRLSPRSAYFIWMSVLFASIGAAIWMLVWQDASFSFWQKLSLTSLIVLFYPNFENVWGAQASPFLLVLLLIMFLADRRGHNAPAGMALGFACLLKVFPAVMFGYLILWKRWRTIGWAIATGTVGLAITVALVGTRNSVDFLSRFGYLNGLLCPLSVVAFVSHCFQLAARLPLSPKILQVGLKISAPIAQFAVIGCAVKGTLGTSRNAEGQQRSFALWLIAMVLLTPTAWAHYMTFFLPMLVQLASAANRRLTRPLALLCGVGVYLLAEIVGILWLPHQVQGYSANGTLIYGLFFPCGLLAIAAAYLYCVQSFEPPLNSVVLQPANAYHSRI